METPVTTAQPTALRFFIVTDGMVYVSRENSWTTESEDARVFYAADESLGFAESIREAFPTPTAFGYRSMRELLDDLNGVEVTR